MDSLSTVRNAISLDISGGLIKCASMACFSNNFILQGHSVGPDGSLKKTHHYEVPELKYSSRVFEIKLPNLKF